MRNAGSAAFGESWEEVMRLCFLVVDGELPENAARMETVWRDPATPTTAAAADALGKLKDSLEIPAQALWEKVPGVTQEEVRRWKAGADAERTASARAQATAFGLDVISSADERTRDRVLADYCQQLASWASGQVVRLWRGTDPADIRGSWLTVYPAILEVHKATVVQALKAVDDYMFAKAADAGFLYETTWEDDYPSRAEQVYWGEASRTALGRTPVVVLSGIGRGDPVDVAMLAGLNYLLSIVGTEAHQIQRTVTLERMLAQ